MLTMVDELSYKELVLRHATETERDIANKHTVIDLIIPTSLRDKLAVYLLA